MAIYHFSAQAISRSTGRSAVACAAYRSAERLHDERYDRDHDYTRKEDVVHTEIMLPKDAPAWMKDREALWNAVEESEKRKDAQLAREFNISLPRELTLEQNVQLIKEFVQTQCVDKGMIADVCLHNDIASDGGSQLHAHVMLTLRTVGPEGFGQKERSWNDKSVLLNWRESWSELANKQLALNGHDIRIDHRTLADQGIDLEPQRKVGPVAAHQKHAALEEHQRIAKENGERLMRDPDIALEVLTRQQATFTHHDIARTINRYTVDAAQFQTVQTQVLASKQLVNLGQDNQGRDRYTTQAMLEVEQKLVWQVERLAARASHSVNPARLEKTLAASHLSEQQQGVLRHIVEQGSIRCFVGYAGTGKSHLLGVAREIWEAEGYQLHGATLSGIAAENLQGSSGIASRTVASSCYRWDRGQDKLTDRDILVIDEAGMLGSRQLGRLIDEVHKAGAKVIVTGDQQQFQAIEAGASFRATTQRAPTAELTEIWRQKEEWQREATQEFAQGKTAKAFNRYEVKEQVHEFSTQDQARQALIERWDATRKADPNETQLIFSYTRKDAKLLNEEARALRQQNGELGPDQLIKTEQGEQAFSVHDRLYFLKNDTGLAVRNGTLGTVTAIDEQGLTVRLDGDKVSKEQPAREVRVNLAEYNQIAHGYAATLHKGQGVTIDRSFVLGSKHMDSHATYVGSTRHRETYDFFWSREEFGGREALLGTLSRDRSKDMAVDYLGHDEQGNRRSVAQSLEQPAQTRPLTAEIDKIINNQSLSPEERYRQARDGIVQKEQGVKQVLPESLQRSTPAQEQPMTVAIDKIINNKNLSPEERYQQAKAKLDKLVADREDPSKFKSKFESQNPELAKEAAARWLPVHEKEAHAALQAYQGLEQKLEKSGFSKDLFRNELDNAASKLMKDKNIMNYAKDFDKGLADRIMKRAKSHELDRDRGGRSL